MPTQRVLLHLSGGRAHVLGDGDPGKVEEGNGEDDEGEQPTKCSRVGHLGERIWKCKQVKVKVEEGNGVDNERN